jgi:predicted Rossmann fold flavoprotein
MHVAIVGGGAAGFFSAIQVSLNHPQARVTIFEKTTKVLSKVKVSGGGRCNVTHACFDVNKLIKNYPRGERFLKPLFHIFGPEQIIHWFNNRSVLLKTEKDGRMFPVSDDSQTIIDCFLSELKSLQIDLVFQKSVVKLEQTKGKLQLYFDGGECMLYDKVIVTTGGSSKKTSYTWLEELGHTIVSPQPSLFTFNMPLEPICALMGVSVLHAKVSVVSEKMSGEGPLLITHWGMSGPAILKLSALAARILSEKQYIFQISVQWTSQKEHELRAFLAQEMKNLIKRQISNRNPFQIPQRLWDFLLQKIEINPSKIWADLRKEELNRMMNVLCNDQYQVKGKTTFKEEFVTCGGVDLSMVHNHTLESKIISGLYFAGEVLDIDGVTGGFNFQSAWTTAFIAGQLLEQ